MSLLGPFSLPMFLAIAGAAALLAIGAYIIKMRRRRFEVPFSHLWRRVLEQKDANALWKQLKRLLSLLLILGILAIVLFAALDPTLGAVDRDARSVVILFDASASMKTMDGDEAGAESRLAAAKTKAKELVDSMGGGDLAMVMKVDGQATPMSRFTSDGPMLNKIIDGIEASDTPADLTRALGAAADALRDRKNPLIVLVSDGAYPEQQLGLATWEAAPAAAPAQPKLAPAGAAAWAARNLASVDLSQIDVRYVPVGRRSDNVGIVAFNVRRYIANKAAYEVYIEVQNFGAEPANRELVLYNGNTAVDIKKLQLAPGERIKRIYPRLPASGDHKLRALLRPGQGPGASDAFALDDQAFALLPVSKKQKVLLVATKNLFLEAALLANDDVDERMVTPAEYDANPAVADGFDVVIFDEHTPSELPPAPANLMFFHPRGPNSPIAVRSEAIDPRITEIDEDHPAMVAVSMSDVHIDKAAVFAPDSKRNESTLMYAVRQPIVAARRESKRKILAIGFSLPSLGRDSASDAPLRVAFPVLMINALTWFAGDTTDLLTTYPTGSRERIPLDGVVGATEAEVTGPDGSVARTPVIDGLATFYGARVGYYDVAAKGPNGVAMAQISLAANLASPSESDIAPSAELVLGGKKLAAPEAFAITHSRKLWIYLVLLAMALIVMEWVTYHRRITV